MDHQEEKITSGKKLEAAQRKWDSKMDILINSIEFLGGAGILGFREGQKKLKELRENFDANTTPLLIGILKDLRLL